MHDGSPHDPSSSVYAISIAAQLTDLHPQTLRNYERHGLIEPARSSGGNRLYSDHDLARLAMITELTEEGLNISGVRRVMELEAQVRRLNDEVETLRAQDESRLGTTRR